ncbi:histidine phosphatase family protein [Paenibacillus sp. IITD108]|uniref:histidine phosphatase family protein n=1 Tax=Paenibacillus sp. IITD108 TaxID=3116649 RepID=UPI002F409A8A
METILYFVRHADSVFVEGSERTRGLSDQGVRDAQVVRNILKNAQKRAVNVITSIIESNKGRKIVIGTHGDIMTLMLNHFDNRYGYSFWESTSMPDIYKLTLDANKLIAVERMWGNGER